MAAHSKLHRNAANIPRAVFSLVEMLKHDLVSAGDAADSQEAQTNTAQLADLEAFLIKYPLPPKPTTPKTP